MTDHTQRSANEARTHELFSEETYTAKKIEWSQERQVVAMVFRAMWSSALTAEHIQQIGVAMAHMETIDLGEMLTKLTRAKILRSYAKRGVRLYEVNY